ncbi:MAG TPA: hypothetical protein VGG37_05880 [Opitutaceae bacterium]
MIRILSTLSILLALSAAGAQAQTASNITGLYYTGLDSSGGLQAGGATDANWTVSYASTNGGTSANSTYEGAAYVIDAADVSGSGYTQNTSTAQWITAPGAKTSSGTSPNTGGDFLPGNGDSGSNEGIYIYTLAFTITGTGTNGSVIPSSNSKIQITMTLAADDQYSVYVNPSGNGSTLPTGTAAATQDSAWSNKSQITLQNFNGSGGTNNSQFKLGTNYIVIVVDNTNSVSGSSSSTSLNASGLLVYQTSAATINGAPVPEVSTWIPLFGAIGLYGYIVLRRRREALRPVPA